MGRLACDRNKKANLLSITIHHYNLFGGLPEAIEDDWIETEEKLEQMMDQYKHLRDIFEMRYQDTVDPAKDRWELCGKVLARRDVVERMERAW